MTHFRSLGQKSKNNFVRFLVQMRTRKFAFEIYWPLTFKSLKLWFRYWQYDIFCKKNTETVFEKKHSWQFSFLGQDYFLLTWQVSIEAPPLKSKMSQWEDVWSDIYKKSNILSRYVLKRKKKIWTKHQVDIFSQGTWALVCPHKPHIKRFKIICVFSKHFGKMALCKDLLKVS